jgi:hypothetical protein
MKHHLIIVYDSIENSVFEGQLLAPMAQKLANNSADRGLIISFEKQQPSSKSLNQFTKYPNIDYLILKKIPFLGSISLRYATYQLNRILHRYSIQSIVARGPLAGWIAARTSMLKNIPCTVQARGLAAQEYRYEHDNKHGWLMRNFHRFRALQYEAIERYVYGTYAQQSHVTITTVSNALQQYLATTFGTPSDKIIVDTGDIPFSIDRAIIATWRTAMRSKININMNSYVYVYNGSAKSWQCPEQTIAYFVKEYTKNTNAFLLILTQNKEIFLSLCTQYEIPEHAYFITHVSHQEIYPYLAAADAGIILRKPHIINWVSRPTKILEYQAVGLKIIHNNTVGMLVEKE